MEWNSKRREAERERDAALAMRDAAIAERDEMKRKYEPPVTVRQVLYSGMESNRRRH